MLVGVPRDRARVLPNDRYCRCADAYLANPEHSVSRWTREVERWLVQISVPAAVTERFVGSYL